MEDEVRDDGKMQMEEQKIRSELWVQERMEKQEYMEMLQQIEVLADDIWSEVVQSDDEKSWRKSGDPVDVCHFGGAVGELWKII